MNIIETTAERTYVQVSKGKPKKTYEREGLTETATLTLSGILSEICISALVRATDYNFSGVSEIGVC